MNKMKTYDNFRLKKESSIFLTFALLFHIYSIPKKGMFVSPLGKPKTFKSIAVKVYFIWYFPV